MTNAPFSDFLIFFKYLEDNPDWALSQVLYGALFGLAILFIAVWTDFGFVLDFIFGLPSFFSKKKLISFTKDRPSQQLDLSEIEGDISLDTQNAITSEHANHQISSTEFDRNQSPERSASSMDSWPTPPEALCPVKQDTSFAKISRISRSINNYIPKGDAFFRASGMPVGGGRFNSVERKSFLTDNPTTRRSAFKLVKQKDPDYAELPLRMGVSSENVSEDGSTYDNSEYGIRLGTWNPQK
ncbi:unnamed protein product [Oikopleura dioica]|uniref:Uncharacterized protein n=1 Tax=Oikopleura dioica TaxID=34765 RepID=E4XNU7_OIKDI|nr:unnamed protein product [Oikopleura dioica]